MKTYEERLLAIKTRADLDRQITLAGAAAEKSRKATLNLPLRKKLLAKKIVRLHEEVEYKLKFDYYEILKIIGDSK